MADIRGIVLYKILSKEDGFLEVWSKLKLGYFGQEYSSIYKMLAKFYLTHSDLPSFSELEIFNRNSINALAIEALKSIEVPDVELDLALEALINDFTQEETLAELDKFVDHITILSAEEIKEELGNILLNVEEKTLSSEDIVRMDEIELTTEPELLGLMPLGINNTFDAEIGGMAPTEVLALGGMRGSGKSILSENLWINQYEYGKSSLYFTIEMRAREIFNRALAMLSGVPLTNIIKADLTDIQLDKIAKVRAHMFEGGEEVYHNYIEHNDYTKFKNELIYTKKLKENNQLVIVDNPSLTLASIDLNIQKFKAQFGDSLNLVVVDYLNVINVEDKYDWKVQVATSAKLKEIARKHDIILAAPYQIDKTGEARFSKGILDSVDIAMTLNKSEGRIDFESTKTRNMKPFTMASPIDDRTMRIDPNDANLPPKEEAEPEEKKESKNEEKSQDLPWH